MIPPGTVLPPGFTYLPGVIPDADAHLAGLVAEVPWEDHVFRIYGRTMPMPRRIAWFGEVPYGYSGLRHAARPFPPRIVALAAAVHAATGHRFNGVLVNLYRGGADSMSWHADDDYPPGETAAIASVSLGAARRFDLRSRRAGATSGPDARASILLEHGSVLLMGEGTQAAWQHQLPKTARDVGVRVNLTFRSISAMGVSAPETTSAAGEPGAPTGPEDGLAPRSGRRAPPPDDARRGCPLTRRVPMRISSGPW